MRGLSSKLIENILRFNPKEVEFIVDYPESIECTIVSNSGAIGYGIAICSTSEWEWDEKRARNLAAGRAVKALVNQESSEPIREDYLFFPQSWSIQQANRVLNYAALLFKSKYYGPCTQCFNL
jgi:hypothetical protein